MSNTREKYFVLTLHVFYTTLIVITTRYSRTVKISSVRYLSSTTVVITEIIKLLTCLTILLVQEDYSLRLLWQKVKRDVVGNYHETIKLAVPALSYTFQNNLLFIALSNLDAATYQVTYQLKILMAAFFSVVILKTRLPLVKWASLLILTVGVSLVQLSVGEIEPAKDEQHGDEASQLVGFSAILVASVTSGFAGVYFEKVLKSSQQSLWIRNIQLALISMIVGVFYVLFIDYHAVMSRGFFQGYDKLTWIIIFLQSYSGLIVSLVIKYTGNILKCIAAALAIISSMITSALILGDFSPNRYFYIGSTTVLFATFLYTVDFSPKKKTS